MVWMSPKAAAYLVDASLSRNACSSEVRRESVTKRNESRKIALSGPVWPHKKHERTKTNVASRNDLVVLEYNSCEECVEFVILDRALRSDDS